MPDFAGNIGMTSPITWFSEDILPPLMDLWGRLDVPQWELYREALHTCLIDCGRAAHSSSQLVYLTMRPLCILLWIFLQLLWRNLLEHGGRSLQKGAAQAKVAAIWFWKFQRSLTYMQLLGEVILMATFVGLYYLHRWLRKQTYWVRFTKWSRIKKEQAVQTYTKLVHRVAQVSTFLAMALPHSVFLVACITFRVFFPSISRWLVHDTFVTAVLSVWSPLFSTLFLVTSRRHSDNTVTLNDATRKKDDGDCEKESPARTSPGSRRSAGSTTTTATTACSSSLRNRKKSSKSTTAPANSNVPAGYSQANLASTPSGSTLVAASARLSMSPQGSTTYWLQYWHVYGIVKAFGTFLSSIPIFGGFVMRHPLLLLLTAELKLLFFVWLFGMEMLLPSSKDTFLANALPLRLVHRFITPILLRFVAIVSDAVPEKRWHDWVVSKSEGLLQMFVLVRFISVERKDWILHALTEARSLVIPSISLFMPGFVTQFGVVYVQYLVPSAKSAQARGDGNKVLYLQYWIMHCILAGILTWPAVLSVLWWIPFSTHLIFLLWCYLELPKTIQIYYNILEYDLAAFGMLKVSGGPASINDTKTAKLLNALASRLPSASNDDGTEGNGGDENVDQGNQNDNGDESIPGLATKTLSTQDDESVAVSEDGAATISATTGLAG